MAARPVINQFARLYDVDVASPADGDALVYDSASSKWKNTNGGSRTAIDPRSVAPVALADEFYNAFGTLGRFSDGTLVMVYRQAMTHQSDDGVLVMRTLAPGADPLVATNWTDPVQIAAESGVDLRNAAGCVTSTDRLLVFYTRFDTGSLSQLSFGFIYSDDRGATWAPFTAITTTLAHFNFYGEAVESGGAILQPLYGSTPYSVQLIKSTDDGVTWGAPVTIVSDASTQYGETSIADLGAGTILAVGRISNSTTFYQAISTDSGATWTLQGTTSFDSWLTPGPPTLKTFHDNGVRTVACYWTNRTALVTRVIYARAASLATDGTSAWGALGKPYDIGEVSTYDSGYVAVVHPDDDVQAVGWYYDAAVALVAPAAPTVFAIDSLTHLALLDAYTRIAQLEGEIPNTAGQPVGLLAPAGLWPSTTLALTASRRYMLRVAPTKDVTVSKIRFSVVTAAGANDSCDVGILDSTGVPLVSSGATAGKLNAGGVKEIAISPTTLRAGSVYFVTFAYGTAGGTAATLAAYTFGSSGVLGLFANTVNVPDANYVALFKDSSYPIGTTQTNPTAAAATFSFPVLAALG